MPSTITSTPKSAADLTLERRVLLTLGQLHVPLFRFLQVDVTEGTVTLRGRVGSYYERQLAQSRARRVPGVIRLVDSLTVIERPGESGSLAGLLTRTVSSRALHPSAEFALTASSATDQSPEAARQRRIA